MVIQIKWITTKWWSSEFCTKENIKSSQVAFFFFSLVPQITLNSRHLVSGSFTCFKLNCYQTQEAAIVQFKCYNNLLSGHSYSAGSVWTSHTQVSLGSSKCAYSMGYYQPHVSWAICRWSGIHMRSPYSVCSYSALLSSNFLYYQNFYLHAFGFVSIISTHEVLYL